MANGRTHDKASKWAAISAGAILGVVSSNLTLAWTTTLTMLLWGLYFSPDLDLAENKHGCNAKRRWGVLGFYWVPYGKLFKHRGLSHWLILGTATRMIYGLWPLLWWSWENYRLEVALFVFVCGCVSDAVHLFLDWM